MTPMISMLPLPAGLRNRLSALRTLSLDLPTIVLLIGLDVVARLLPHVPDFTPIAASGLFAASVLRLRGLSLVVPLVGMMGGDALVGGFYDWRIMICVYGALMLPALAASVSIRLCRPRMVVPVLLSSSLLFFLVSNFAVWAFSPLYAGDAAGLVKCNLAALPFLRLTIAGDLFWGAMLFGCHWLLQIRQAGKAPAAAARGAV
jgi:hypothetical protein